MAKIPPDPSLAAAALGDLRHAFGDLHAAAIDRAKLWRLLADDGTFWCAGCGTECPFHVSLHCDWCLQEHHNKRAEQLRRQASRSWEDLRWEAMARNIATLLDNEQGQRLIDKALELPSATTDRMQALRMTYARRWAPRPPGATYAAASAQEDPAEVWDRD